MNEVLKEYFPVALVLLARHDFVADSLEFRLLVMRTLLLVCCVLEAKYVVAFVGFRVHWRGEE